RNLDEITAYFAKGERQRVSAGPGLSRSQVRFPSIDMPASFCNHGSQFEGLSPVGSQPAGLPQVSQARGRVDFVTGIIRPVPWSANLALIGTTITWKARVG